MLLDRHDDHPEEQEQDHELDQEPDPRHNPENHAHLTLAPWVALEIAEHPIHPFIEEDPEGNLVHHHRDQRRDEHGTHLGHRDGFFFRHQSYTAPECHAM